jgi:acetyl esterase
MNSQSPSNFSERKSQVDLLPGAAKLKLFADRYRGPTFKEMGVEKARSSFASSTTVVDIKPEQIMQVDDWTIRLTGRELLLRRYAHQLNPVMQAAMLYLHGGGFTIGSVATHDSLCRSLAKRSGVMVLSLNYRLAPEHPFPAAFDDTFDTLQWLITNALQLGIDSDRIAIGGDSAGATLAAAVAIAAKQHAIKLRLQMLIHPGLAAEQNSASHQEFGKGYLLEKEVIDWFFDQYLPNHRQRFDWRFAPLVYDDFQGLAPVWMALASHDPLRDDGLLYAEKLSKAGVPTEVKIVNGVMHNFMMHGGLIPEVLSTHEDAAQALATALLTE